MLAAALALDEAGAEALALVATEATEAGAEGLAAGELAGAEPLAA